MTIRTGDELGEDLARALEIAQEIVDDIEGFADECGEQNYTDTGDAWDLLDRIYGQLFVMLGKPLGRPDVQVE